jgi:hypothetical protein
VSADLKSKHAEAPPRKIPRYKKHPVWCWRCYKKRKAPPRDKRRSRVFRRICAHCLGWHELNAKERRAQGRKAFMPAHIIRKRDDAATAARAAEDLSKRGTLCDANDPLRDYTYWVQHERALKKGSP